MSAIKLKQIGDLIERNQDATIKTAIDEQILEGYYDAVVKIPISTNKNYYIVDICNEWNLTSNFASGYTFFPYNMTHRFHLSMVYELMKKTDG